MPDPQTESLFARLNALKPSSIWTLNPDAPQPLTTQSTAAAGDDLTARFTNLNTSSSSRLARARTDISTEEQVEDTLLSASKVGEDDEQSLEDLLKELGEAGSDYEFIDTDEGSIKDSSLLLLQARDAMNESKQEAILPGEDDANIENTIVDSSKENTVGQDTIQAPELSEDQEAENYISAALAEAALSPLDDVSTCSEDEQPPHKSDERHSPSLSSYDSADILNLPSIPSLPPQISSQSQLLPPAPTFSPASKLFSSSSSAVKLSTNSPDEEVETWCCICNADATVKCLGCDGDLYCGDCWNEGHRGPDAGYEEMRHRATRFVKPEGREKKKAVKKRAIQVGS